MFNARYIELGQLLNDACTPEKRIVAYHGIGTVASQFIIGAVTKNDKTVESFKNKAPLVIRQIALLLNEIGVVDVPLLSGIIQTHIDFRTKTIAEKGNTSELVYSSGCFEDTLKITTYFSKETIELINKNFTDFKKAMQRTADVKEKIERSILED